MNQSHQGYRSFVFLGESKVSVWNSYEPGRKSEIKLRKRELNVNISEVRILLRYHDLNTGQITKAIGFCLQTLKMVPGRIPENARSHS